VAGALSGVLQHYLRHEYKECLDVIEQQLADSRNQSEYALFTKGAMGARVLPLPSLSSG
jgi:hypothetical protein